MNKDNFDPLDVDETIRNAQHGLRDMEQSLGELPTMQLNQKGLGRVDRYELLEKVGEGGFGAVYMATDTISRVVVAIKMIPREVAADTEEMEEVRYNFGLTSCLHHPHIASLLHLHEVEQLDAEAQKLGFKRGDYLTIMEYAFGRTLFAWRRSFTGRAVPVERALEVCRQIADALDYAHSKQIIHRDLKPKNVMLEDPEEIDPENSAVGVVKVLDFGLAADIRSSLSRASKGKAKYGTSGTPFYMAPEQWKGSKQGAASDQYSLAVLFYELVSGEVPFQSVFLTDDKELMLNAVVNNPVEPLEALDAKQNAVLLRALSKNPEERFESCSEFIGALEGKRVGPQNTRKSAGKKPSIGNREWVIGAALAIAILGGAWWSYQSYTSHQQRKAETVRVAQMAAEKQEQINSLLQAAQEQFDKEQYAEASDFVAKVLGLDAANITAQKLQDRIKERQEEEKRKTVENLLEKVKTYVDNDQYGEASAFVANILELDKDHAEAKKWKSQIEKKLSPEALVVLKNQAQKSWDEVKKYNREQGFGEKMDALQVNLDVGIYLLGTKHDPQGAYAHFRNVVVGCVALQEMEKERQFALAVKQYETVQQEWLRLYGNIDKALLESHSSSLLSSAISESRKGAALSANPVAGKSSYEKSIGLLKEAENKVQQILEEKKKAQQQVEEIKKKERFLRQGRFEYRQKVLFSEKVKILKVTYINDTKDGKPSYRWEFEGCSGVMLGDEIDYSHQVNDYVWVTDHKGTVYESRRQEDRSYWVVHKFRYDKIDNTWYYFKNRMNRL